jgi:hypothetical protein
MALSPISSIEPVAAPTKMNTYEYEDNSGFTHNQEQASKQNQSSNYRTQNQIVFMERSVQDYLGQHLNFYA